VKEDVGSVKAELAALRNQLGSGSFKGNGDVEPFAS
jgi:hypothetical protein